MPPPAIIEKNASSSKLHAPTRSRPIFGQHQANVNSLLSEGLLNVLPVLKFCLTLRIFDKNLTKNKKY